MRMGCAIDAVRSSGLTVLAQYLKLARGRRVDDAAAAYVRAGFNVALAANALPDSGLHRAFETFVMSGRASTRTCIACAVRSIRMFRIFIERLLAHARTATTTRQRDTREVKRIKSCEGRKKPGPESEKPLQLNELQGLLTGGVDGTRTRDPRRDRPVF
jgi:hypothetical protein